MSTLKQIHKTVCPKQMGFPGGARAKTPPSNAGDVRDAGSAPGSGRPPAGGQSNPLQYSCPGNPTDGRLAGYSP